MEKNRRRFPRSRRITSGDEIRQLFRRGVRRRLEHLDIFDTAATNSYSRVGIVVPRHRHSAVARNRLKRRLRELSRLQILPRLDDSAAGVRDVLIRARREAYAATYPELEAELLAWTARRCSVEPSSS